MKQTVGILALFIGITVVTYAVLSMVFAHRTLGAPPDGDTRDEALHVGTPEWIASWKRPAGLPRVGIQVGHLQNSDLPDELAHLRNNGGAIGGGYNEWEVNNRIAEETAALLRQQGIEVDILPATIPPSYWADAFIAIHADGSESTKATGFKVAAPWRDLTGNAGELVSFIEESYQKSTGLSVDPNITRNMRGYYAFSWWRHEHAIHPMTTAVIVETGFLTNPSDRQIIVEKPELSALGLANGIAAYLADRNPSIY